jgi:hypothetical protein
MRREVSVMDTLARVSIERGVSATVWYKHRPRVLLALDFSAACMRPCNFNVARSVVGHSDYVAWFTLVRLSGVLL